MMVTVHYPGEAAAITTLGDSTHSTGAQVDILISHTLGATWLSDWPEIKPENCLLNIYLISLIVKTTRIETDTSNNSSLTTRLPPLKILSSAFSPTSETDLKCYEYFTIREGYKVWKIWPFLLSSRKVQEILEGLFWVVHGESLVLTKCVPCGAIWGCHNDYLVQGRLPVWSGSTLSRWELDTSLGALRTGNVSSSSWWRDSVSGWSDRL